MIIVFLSVMLAKFATVTVKHPQNIVALLTI